jgi:hypothetical protein
MTLTPVHEAAGNGEPNPVDHRAPGVPRTEQLGARYMGTTGEGEVCLRMPAPQVQRPIRGAPAFGA